MWYRKQLRLIRRARRAARAQQHWLLVLELDGLTAVTLHTHARQLTIPVERAEAGQLVDTLREALRDRRRAWKQEARQLRQDWQESQRLRAHERPTPPSPAAQ
ncbi:hypothetical protein E4631_19765 [Hymenobacter sp. UV11]|jgi:hypothetical protein|uniref:hypothetical protein n=1 Tax=Hymenobacter sp. UV11 TaxID=1849735 RepID=UPI00105BF234|nr:hypothetical protein [Hymenobacter sp. UV11]TDN37000.1 hypothetical protein A8B98_06305 [Hymenobacter sp. UV11]TFZ64241.1 hypothetical protein E4631_19765 [Hymenobacter sp. UV11]